MIHHMALAVKNLERAHEFYTKAMGFELVKVVKGVAPGNRGWGRHVFYDSGQGVLFALWDLHLEGLSDDDWAGGMSRGMKLPWWVNHIAFECADEAELVEKRDRWLEFGLKVRELDHDFIHSIYTFDPDGTLVEWTYKTRELTEEERVEAFRLLLDDSAPEAEESWEPKIYLPDKPIDWDVHMPVPAPAFPT